MNPLAAVRKWTFANGAWVNNPPPPQDTEWLKRHGFPTNSEKAERK